jgi:hypothetical protein
MAAEDLVCKRDALAADVDAGAGDQTHAAVAVDLATEGALRFVAHHLGVLFTAAEDQFLSPFPCEAALTGSPSGEAAASAPGDWMMSSISP